MSQAQPIEYQTLHVGYQIDDDQEDVYEKIRKIIYPTEDTQITFRYPAFTAHLHLENGMYDWYNKKKDTQIIGYIRSLYTKQHKNGNFILVATITIESGIYYMTLSLTGNTYNKSLQNVKRMANSGELGPEIKLPDKIPIKLKAYIHKEPIKKPVWGK